MADDKKDKETDVPALTDEQLMALTPEQFGKLSQKQIDSIPDSELSAYITKNPSALDLTGLTGLTSQDLQGLEVLGNEAKAGNPGQSIGDVQETPTKSKTPAKTTTTAPATTTTTAPADPWAQLSDQLAASYASSINALNPIASGQTLASTDAAMSANADTMLGQSSTSPMAQYLNMNTQAAQAQSAGTVAAGAAESAANDVGSAQIAKGLQNLGAAEDQQMASAPYQQLLQSLAAEVPYHLSSGYTIPGLANAPAWLQSAETAAGVNSASSGTSLPGSTSTTKSLPSPTAVASPASTIQTSLDQPSYSFTQGQ